MSDDERIRRPPPERTGPIRDGSTGASEAPHADEGRRAGDDDPLRSVIARSVELGYRVVDEYVRQGQRAARVLSERQVDAESVAREAPEMFSRMLRSASDFASLWLDLAGAAQASGARAWPRPGEAPREPAPPASTSVPREGATPQTGLAIRLDIRASQRAEARLDLRPLAGTDEIVAHDLRSPDPQKPRLRVRCERAEDGALVIAVDVPDGQPTGTYSGLLLDKSTNVPVGSLSFGVAR